MLLNPFSTLPYLSYLSYITYLSYFTYTLSCIRVATELLATDRAPFMKNEGAMFLKDLQLDTHEISK